jgi:RNA binding exosome subunit
MERLEYLNNLKKMDKLKKEIIEQIERKDTYKNIYETSVKIDKLLVKYYEKVDKKDSYQNI